MKKNDLAEIKKMDITALLTRAAKARQELASLVIDKSMNKLPNLKSIRAKRKDLARILTVLRQKQLLQKLEEAHGQK